MYMYGVTLGFVCVGRGCKEEELTAEKKEEEDKTRSDCAFFAD